MPTTSEFFLLQFSFISFFVFILQTEAHLNVICPQKWHFRWRHD